MVAADLQYWGVKAPTIAKMLERRTAPGAALWVAMTCAYGPEFLAAVLPSAPTWLSDAQKCERIRALEAAIEAQRRELDALR